MAGETNVRTRCKFEFKNFYNTILIRYPNEKFCVLINETFPTESCLLSNANSIVNLKIAKSAAENRNPLLRAKFIFNNFFFRFVSFYYGVGYVHGFYVNIISTRNGYKIISRIERVIFLPNTFLERQI